MHWIGEQDVCGIRMSDLYAFWRAGGARGEDDVAAVRGQDRAGEGGRGGRKRGVAHDGTDGDDSDISGKARELVLELVHSEDYLCICGMHNVE